MHFPEIRIPRAAALLTLWIILLAGPIVPAVAQDPPLVIEQINWEIDGRTRLWVLENLLDLEEGQRFVTEEELVAFLLEQQQILINQRQLQESRIEFTIPGDKEETADGIERTGTERGVHVAIHVKDTWNIIALPYARYDSNEGLLLSLRAREYNFFGTLQTLEVDLDYEFTEEEESITTLSMNFNLPFEMLQREWGLILKQSLALEGEELDFKVALGLEYYFTLARWDWTAGIVQEYRYLTDEDDPDTYYFSDEFYLGTGIGTPLRLPGFGRVMYSPTVSTKINYRPGGISADRRGATPGFDHDLGAGRFNWVGNYRDGRTFVVGNDNEYNTRTGTWDNELYGAISAYKALRRPDTAGWPKAGISARLSSFYLINGADEDQDDAARFVRGILNNRMNGDLGVFLNTDAAFTLWTLRPIFEMQVGTFVDVAYVRDTRGDFYDSPSFDRERDLKFGGGIAVVGFPLFARSLFLRGSYGVDLGLVRDGVSPLASKAREIFIGLGHHY